MVLRLWFAALVLALSATACLTPKPPVQYASPIEISVAQLRDPAAQGQDISAVPTDFSERITGAISDRNLQPTTLGFEAIGQTFERVRDTRRRIKIVTEQSPDAEIIVLVETRAVFYSFLTGAYRWTVYAKISVSEPGRLDEALIREMELPAVLYYAHQKEDEALAAVSDTVARKVGQLIDDYLSGRDVLAEPAAQTPPPKTPEPVRTKAPRTDDSIYFVLVDRFANANPGNDVAAEPDNPAGWHGGDLQGVIEHIDYLHDLGVRTIWLSPIFETRTKDFMGHGAFHGYWVEDIRRIDPRFGDKETLATLTEALHERDMRILLDLVVNHVGYEAALLKERPDWFHTEGSIEDWNDPIQVVRREVHGLPDLAQENPEVYDFLLDAGMSWIEDSNIDGFRLDAVKHVPLSFWGRYNKALLAKDSRLTLLGEMFDGSVKKVDAVQREGRFTHMFDFPLAFALRDVFCGDKPAERIGAVLSNDRLYTDPRTLVTFLDNHDMPRIRSLCGGDIDKVAEAMTAQMALRGTPSINYGTESGLEGKEEPHNRPDMVFDPSEGRPLKARLKSLLRLRRDNPVFAHGTTRILAQSEDLLVFARAHGDEAAIVFINSADKVQEAPLPSALEGAEVRAALTGATRTGPMTLGPGQTRILLARGDGLGSKLAPPSGTREIKVTVEGADLKEGESLVMVGSGPEMGGWDPARGAGAFTGSDGRYAASLQLPMGVVFAYKLVVRTASGEARWESGDDRYIFVAPGTDPLDVSLTLRGG